MKTVRKSSSRAHVHIRSMANRRKPEIARKSHDQRIQQGEVVFDATTSKESVAKFLQWEDCLMIYSLLLCLHASVFLMVVSTITIYGQRDLI